MLKLFLIEGQPAVGRGLHLLLDSEPDLRVVGEAVDFAGALRTMPAASPDVVIVDIDVPRFDHGEATHSLRHIGSSAPLILLTLRDNAQTDLLARDVGASAVVIKSAPADSLLTAIRGVSRK